MDRCSGCGGTLTSGGCINVACMRSLSGHYVNGQKVAPLHPAQPTIDVPSIMRATGYEEGTKAEREAIAWWLDDFARGQDQHVGIPFGDLLRECARRIRLRGTSETKAQ